MRRVHALHASLVLAVCTAACSPPFGLHSDSRPSFSVDRRAIVVAANNLWRSQVVRFPRDGGAGTSLSRGFDAVQPAMSQDGRWLAFVARESGHRSQVWAGDIETRAYRPIGPPPTARQSRDALPVFLADGRIVFFRSQTRRITSTLGRRWVDWQMFSWNPRTGRSEAIGATTFPDLRGAAACGMSLYVGVDGPEDDGIIERFDLSGPEAERVEFDWPGVSDPSPARDCLTVLGVARTGTSDATGYFEYEVVERRQDSTRTVPLTRLGSYVTSPVMSPAGDSVLFLSDPERDGTFELWELPTRTGRPRRLALDW